MKKLLLLFFLFISISISAQTGIHVSGRFILDKCNDTLILKGVNYPVLDDWDFPAVNEVSAQIAQSGANAVRIMWYINYGQPSRPPYSLSDLDTVITRVRRLGMVPIVDLHDYTCNDVLTNLNNAVNWFTSAPVINLINKHHEYLILNILNEFGFVAWEANPPVAEVNFKNAYIGAVSSLRAAGINVPLMIDAPDCGENISSLINISNDLQTNDPQHNLLFSAHAYWYAYANNNPANFQNLLSDAVASNQPFVLGEVANYLDTLDANFNTVYCAYALNYSALIPIADNLKTGWIWWAWYKDNCIPRQLTTNGNYNALTAAGMDVVNNATYGLQSHAVKTNYFLNGNCTTGIHDVVSEADVSVYPTLITNSYIHIAGLKRNTNIEIYSSTGQLLSNFYIKNEPTNLNVGNLNPGIYFIKIKNDLKIVIKRFVVL